MQDANTFITNSTIDDNVGEYSLIFNSNISFSTINISSINSSVISYSTVINSLYTIINSTIINSTIDNSTIINSTVTNSTIVNSSILNSNILNSILTNFTSNNCTLSNLNASNLNCLNGNVVGLNIQFVSPTTASGNYSQNFILANVTGSNFVNMTIRLFNSIGLINSSTSTSSPLFVNFSGLANGYYYLNATAYGLFGNPNSTETRAYLLDTTAPIIDLLTPVNNTYSNASIVNFTANIQDFASNCYQETANASTAGDGSCGLNYSGSYFNIGSDILDPQNYYDGDWNTYGYNTLVASTEYMYVNYTKPNNIINVKWEVKDAVSTANLTLPSLCYQSNIIQLRIGSKEAGASDQALWDCYNSTTWINLRTSTAGANNKWIYEEAMIWGVGTGIGIANATLTIQNLSGYIINETTQTYAPGIFETIIGIPVYLIDGIYNWFFTATDYLSNVVQSVINTITVDTTYPGIIITYPTNGTYYNYVVTALNYTLTEINPDTCWYSTNSGVTNTSITCGNNVTGLTATEGFNNWWLAAINDSANNRNSSMVSFFVDTINPSVSIIYPQALNYSTNVSSINFSATDANLQTCWYSTNGGATNITTDCALNLTGLTSIEDYNSWLMGANDSAGNINSSSVTFFKDTITPLISIISPTTNIPYHALNTNLTLNWTLTELNPSSCWYDYKGTNTSVTCSANTTQFNITDYGNRTLILYANDTLNNINSDSISWNYSIFENSRTFNPTGYETDNENFSINITLGTDFTTVFGYLIYNGISHTASRFGDTFYTIASLPSTTSNFYWSFYNTTFTINTSSSSQSSTPINFQSCNATTNVTYVNFTLKDENTLSTLNGSFFALFNYWLGDGNVKNNYSYANNSNTRYYFDFCAEPSQKTFYVDMSSEYSSSGYSDRTYLLSESVLTNTTNNIDLFLLNESDSVKFFFTTLQGLTPVADAFVTISKKDTSTGNYNAIGIRETDDSGKFIEYLELDKEYQFTIIKSGTLLGTLYKTSICSTAPCEIELEISEALNDFWTGYYDVYAQNVAYNLTYDEEIKTINFVFTDLSGLAQYFRLQVFEIDYNQTGDTICDSFVYTTSGTISCNLTGYEGQFRGNAYISRSPEKLIDTIFANIKEIAGAIKDVVGGEGLLFTLLLVITVGLIGFWNPAVGIILIVATLFFSTILGFISISITSITLIVILAIFLIIKMGRGT